MSDCYIFFISMGKEDEKIMGIGRDIIFERGAWQGLKRDDLDYYLALIRKHFQFKRRGEVERDPSFQQVIPYIVFNFRDKYFLYRYLRGAGERRLINDYMLGIGGHINWDDELGEGDTLEKGMMREWQEEVYYKGNLLEKRLVGILNDDSREVERVHLGLVYIFKGDSPAITVKEKETIRGRLMTIREMKEPIAKSQGWAPIVYSQYLLKQQL